MFLVFLGIGSLFFALFILPTIWLKVEKNEVKLDIGKKVLQISDVHISKMRVSIEKINRVIIKENPNYIFLTGDYIDNDVEELIKLEKMIKMLNTHDVGIFGVLGNHDRKIKVESIISLFKKYNIAILMNESVEMEDFVLVGIDDFCKGKHDIEKSFSFDNSADKKVLVITHDPNIVDHISNRYDFLMAGHLHGKQFNVPFLFKISNRGSLPNRGIYKGRHEVNNRQIYISKGIGQTRWNFRFLIRSEISVHNI